MRCGLSLLSAVVVAFGAAATGCHPDSARTGGIESVAVVLVGADEPLPFDPRGGRITVVTRQITELVGHPVILELETALGPELKASLEESVLASFENVVRELVWLQKHDPEIFAAAKRIERIRCRYDAVAKESTSRLHGAVLEVRSPPERFPLLERDLLVEAVYEVHVDALERRWGEADPTKLAAADQASWFQYMTMTRPGAGYLWMRARSHGQTRPGLRAEHLARILQLAAVVPRGSALETRVSTFLVEQGSFVATTARPEPGEERVAAEYGAWLARALPTLGDAHQQNVARLLWSRQPFQPRDVPPLPRFDRLAFGLSVYDRWVKEGAPVSLPAGPHGELEKEVLCPTALRGEDATEIHFGCSGFFAQASRDASQRARLATRIETTHDERLLDLALLNLDFISDREAAETKVSAGDEALALLERLQDKQLFHHGFRVLFDEHARRDDVRAALETAAFRWWRDVPARRGMAVLVLARKNERLDPHYGDNQWERLAPELGGPLTADVLASYLAEGPRAVEMLPKIWKGLARTSERDTLAGRSLSTLLDRDVAARTSRSRPALVLLRRRYCEERNGAGLATLRSALQGWAAAHPNDARMVTTSIADATLARCATPDDDTH